MNGFALSQELAAKDYDIKKDHSWQSEQYPLISIWHDF
jgi:hypothetical protein